MLAEGELVGDVVGEVGKDDDGVLHIRRIHVTHKLQVDSEHREAAERVHGFHADKCPLARSIKAAIEVTTDLEFV